MRGLKVKNVHTAKLFRQARSDAGITLEQARALIGFSSINYLSRCEIGQDRFPLARIQLARRVYNLNPDDISRAIMKDYKQALNDFWGGK